MKLFFEIFVIVSILSVCINAQTSPTCVTPTGAQGICQYLRSCNSLFSLLQKVPLTNSDRTHLSRSQCGYSNRQPLVCCPDSITGPPRVVAGSILLPEPGVCGIDTSNRIIGGTATGIDEFPWMVLLQYFKPNNKKGFHCGGVLINQRYVVTASHCVNGKDIPPAWTLSSVRLGEWDLQTDIDCQTDNGQSDCAPTPVDIPVEEKIPHENYKPASKNQENDIALLRLASNVQYTDFVKPICLPRTQFLRTFNYDDILLEVAGWGKTETVSQSNVKLKVGVDGVNINACNQVYSRQGVTIGNSQVCAGGKRGFDSCRGDSGGPIMRMDTSTEKPYWYLAGVVSFGPSPCGQEGWPGVYTRISAYVDWIESKIRA
jgi:secreted trypsin-like serine protease